MILLFRKSKVIFFSLLSNAWLIFLESAHARPPPSRSRENGNGPNKGRVVHKEGLVPSVPSLPPSSQGDRHETNSKCTLLSFPPFSASRPFREERKRKRTTKPKRQLKASPVPPLVVEGGGGGEKFSPFERGRQEQAVRKNIQARIFFRKKCRFAICSSSFFGGVRNLGIVFSCFVLKGFLKNSRPTRPWGVLLSPTIPTERNCVIRSPQLSPTVCVRACPTFLFQKAP